MEDLSPSAPDQTEGAPLTESPAPGPDAAASTGPTFVDDKLVDPNNLPEQWPEEVRTQFGEHFKRMQGSFTKKMQGIGDTQRRAAQLEAVMQYPEIREAVANRLAGKAPQQEPPEPKEDLDSVELSTLSDHELVPHFKKIIQREAQQLLDQHLEKRAPIENATLQMTLTTEASRVDNAMKQEFGDLYDRHRDEVNQYLGQTNPNSGQPIWHELALSGQLLEGARMKFKDLAFDDAFNNGKQSAQDDLKVNKNANLSKSQAPASSVKSKVDYSGMSSPEKWQAAFDQAKREMGMTGGGEF